MVPCGDVVLRGQRLPVSREQKHAVIEALGQERRRRLAQIRRHPKLDSMSENAIARLVRSVIVDATETIHGRVRGRYRDRTADHVDALLESGHAAMPGVVAR